VIGFAKKTFNFESSYLMIYIAIFTGCLLIVALSFYIYSNLKKAKQKALQQQLVIEQHLQEHQDRQTYVSDSINIITKALATDQIEVIEASIRLKVLVDQLRPTLPENSFTAMERVFNETQHIPKLKDWKALDKLQRKQYTKDMNQLDKELSEPVKEEVKLLVKMMEQR
jgi:hypothetical protein